MSAKARGRVSPATEGKPKVRSRPQSCRQPGGKDEVMTANFPSRNCKNIMELLTEADTENLDFLNHKDNVLPSKPFKGRSLILHQHEGQVFNFFSTGKEKLFDGTKSMQWPGHDPPKFQKFETTLTQKDKIAPLPPITSRNSVEEEDDPLVLAHNWQRVDLELEEMTLDEEGWSKWLRSSKPATPLPKIETFRAQSAMK